MDWKNISHWLYGIAAAVITSACNTTLAVLGAAATGDPLNWHQVQSVMISAGFIGALAYLAKSPLPIETIVTTTVVKTEEKKVEKVEKKEGEK